MITYTCDVCKKPITEVVYIILAQDALKRDDPMSEAHVHYGCIAKWAARFC